MKYFTLNHKKLIYNKSKTKKNRQSGGANLVSMIRESTESNIKVIGPQDSNYPSEYIGYNIFLPNEPFSLDNLTGESASEGGFLLDGNLNYVKLDDQVLKDSNRMEIYLNNNLLYENFKKKLTDESFSQKLSELRQTEDIDAFSKLLSEIFPKLNINNDELLVIKKLSNEFTSTINVNFWAYLPYYDEQMNINQIEGDNLAKMKLLNQQNIFKTMVDILQRYVIFQTSDIFQGTLFIGGQFNRFGKMNYPYIKQINPSAVIDISITPNDVILQNKLYQSLINVDKEFGLAVISTCTYIEFSKNQFYLIWKIERWRNIIIKRYYDFIVSMYNKKTPVSFELLNLMQQDLYDNALNDSYPLTLEQELNLFMSIIKNKNYTEVQKNSNVQNILSIVKQNDTKTDKQIAKILKNQVSLKKQIIQTVSNVFNPVKLEEPIEDITSPVESPVETPVETSNETPIEKPIETPLNMPEKNSNINSYVSLENDQAQIIETQNKLNDQRQQLSDDQTRLQNEEPVDTNQTVSKLATASAVAALGAVGTGLYFALPLLALGGSKKNKKTKRKKTIKISNKN